VTLVKDNCSGSKGLGSEEELKEFTDMLSRTQRNIKDTIRELILISIAPNTVYNKLLSGNKRFDFHINPHPPRKNLNRYKSLPGQSPGR
jgi:hypothetical protein